MANIDYTVSATSLNLRSAPRTGPATRIAVLPQDHPVRVLRGGSTNQWWEVTTLLSGTDFTGFVHSAYLAPAGPSPAVPLVPAASLPEVHLKSTGQVMRSMASRRAFPLTESLPSSVPGKPASILDIVQWLDVATHARYLPTDGSTFCNIYAYDTCRARGVFLPRVWWTDQTIATLDPAAPPAPVYGRTVREMNANSLYDWLGDFGAGFGWRRIADVGTLQAAANAGEVCLISAKRRDLNRSGHICLVIPESDGLGRAVPKAGTLLPVQSQAGSRNFVAKAADRWWTADKFSAHAFWACK